MLGTLAEAVFLLARLDPEVLAIVWLSFQVSLGATALAAIFGLPLGAWIAVAEFPGRAAVTVLLNGLMGMPPVVLGVIDYLALSRSGPFGHLGLLFSPTAMVIAQTLLVTSLIAALDPTATEAVERIIREIRADGAEILMTTHNLGQAMRLADDIVFIAGGRVREHSPTARFFSRPQSQEARLFIRGELPWRIAFDD